jgi:hypothetical protein
MWWPSLADLCAGRSWCAGAAVRGDSISRLPTQEPGQCVRRFASRLYVRRQQTSLPGAFPRIAKTDPRRVLRIVFPLNSPCKCRSIRGSMIVSVPTSTTAPATTGGISAAESNGAGNKALSTTGAENIGSNALANKSTLPRATLPAAANNGAIMLEKPSGQPSAAQRLKELNALYKEGLVDEKTFEAKQQEILKGI